MTRPTANFLASFFGTSFVLSAVLQLLVLGMYLGLHDTAYALHSKLFSLTPEQFDLAVYWMLGAMKSLNIIFFLMPWAAIKILARRLPE